MSTLSITTLEDRASLASTPVLNAINGSAKAWVNFNGTGTVAIRASYNVSSITDNGTGDYTVNFTTAMPDVNYATLTSLSRGLGGGTDSNRTANPYLNLTTSVSIQVTVASSQTVGDIPILNAAIFR